MIEKFDKPMTHYYYDPDRPEWGIEPMRYENIPAINFPNGVPLKTILEHLSLDIHGFVSKKSAQNWKGIYEHLQGDPHIAPFSPYGRPKPGVRYNEKLKAWDEQFCINWMGTFREYEYFYKWFEESYFPSSKVTCATFFEWYCLKDGIRYTSNNVSNAIRHTPRLPDESKDKLNAIFRFFTRIS